MYKHIPVTIIPLIILLISCVTPAPRPSSTENILIVTSPAAMTRPLISGWDLGEISSMTYDDFDIAILGVQFSKSGTEIYYSLSASDTENFIAENLITIIDNNGGTNNLINAVLLGKIEAIELGILKFHPRQPGASELSLVVSNPANPLDEQKMMLAKFDGPVAEDRLDLTYTIRRENGVEQANYRIELFLWLPPDIDKESSATAATPGITPTPANISGKPWIELATSEIVQDEFSFQVENISTMKKDYLSIQVFTDGNVISSHNGNLSISKVIDLVGRTSTPVPYPFP